MTSYYCFLLLSAVLYWFDWIWIRTAWRGWSLAELQVTTVWDVVTAALRGLADWAAFFGPVVLAFVFSPYSPSRTAVEKKGIDVEADDPV